MCRRWILTAAILLLALTLVACSRAEMTYKESSTDYNSDSAFAVTEGLSAGDLSQESTEDWSDLRHEALVALRRKGGDAPSAADLITRTFPTESRAVPFYVERAEYEGKPSLLVIEAVGRTGGKLSDKRVWVLSSKGEVLLSGTR